VGGEKEEAVTYRESGVKQTDEGRQMTQETATAQIDVLVDPRAQERIQENEKEEAWKKELKQYHAKKKEANRLEWLRYCYRMQYSHQCLADEYGRKVEELLALGEGTK
jgi:hypothetical protein